MTKGGLELTETLLLRLPSFWDYGHVIPQLADDGDFTFCEEVIGVTGHWEATLVAGQKQSCLLGNYINFHEKHGGFSKSGKKRMWVQELF